MSVAPPPDQVLDSVPFAKLKKHELGIATATKHGSKCTAASVDNLARWREPKV
tara:strand:- start:273 stop:431 length:159 start_codon:yes stop_codon:yes gene_type:complete